MDDKRGLVVSVQEEFEVVFGVDDVADAGHMLNAAGDYVLGLRNAEVVGLRLEHEGKSAPRKLRLFMRTEANPKTER